MMRAVLGLFLSALLAWGGLTQRTAAHALDPGFLSLEPLGGNQWQVLWRVPDVQGRPMQLGLTLPEGCTPTPDAAPSFDGRAWSKRWLATCPNGLVGGAIAIPGLEQTRTDVLVRYAIEPDLNSETKRLTASDIGFFVPVPQGPWAVFQSYLGLGIEHILSGLDHLLFVFALLLLLGDLRRLLLAITAFTVSHSITLGLSSLGHIALPGPPVEAAIALSIVFLAAELARPPDAAPGLTERKPWLVAFAFGLLHGFGFAGALREIGLPDGEVPLALLAFNLGVEAGQIAFVLACLPVLWVLRRFQRDQDHPPSASASVLSGALPGQRIVTYGIGVIAAFWFLQRIAMF